jgi:hypothetical protein
VLTALYCISYTFVSPRKQSRAVFPVTTGSAKYVMDRLQGATLRA